MDNNIYQKAILVFLIKNYDISKPEISKLLEETSHKSKSKIMNAIEAYFTEGEEQGIKKGLHNKNVEAIQKMLEKELPVS